MINKKRELIKINKELIELRGLVSYGEYLTLGDYKPPILGLIFVETMESIDTLRKESIRSMGKKINEYKKYVKK